MLINNTPALLSLDSGCEGDCICISECKRLNIPISPLDSSDTVPTQADGHSPLEIVGKVNFECKRDNISLKFEGYATKNIQSKILCGAPFLERNKIVQELHNNKIIVDGRYHILESPPLCPNPVPTVQISHIEQNKHENYLDQIHIGEDTPKIWKDELNRIHNKYKSVFDGDISEGYNGKSGKFTVDFNFLNNVPPPPHLGCVPSYNKREDDILLQAKIDELERKNIVVKVRDTNIIPKYASPCMLVQKHSMRNLKPCSGLT